MSVDVALTPTQRKARGPAWRRCAALAMTAGMAVSMLAPRAVADDVIRHQPYMDVLNWKNLRATGLDGSGVKIGLIDGRVNTAMPELAGASITNKGFCSAANEGVSGHGSSVLSIMASKDFGWAPKAAYTVYVYPLGKDNLQSNLPSDCNGKVSVSYLLNQALNDRVDLVVITSSAVVGEGAAYDYAVARAVDMKVPVIVAVGNEGNIAKIAPAAQLSGVVAVGSCDLQGAPLKESNRGKGLTILAPGSQTTVRDYPVEGKSQTRVVDGNSVAAPHIAGALSLLKQKYPGVTGNQLIRRLVGTATDIGPAGKDDSSGYGLMSIDGILGQDPRSLEDTNPLMDKGENPTPKQFDDLRSGVLEQRLVAGNSDYVYRGDNEVLAREFPPERRGSGAQSVKTDIPSASPISSRQAEDPSAGGALAGLPVLGWAAVGIIALLSIGLGTLFVLRKRSQ